MSGSDTCDGCGGDPIFRAAVDDGTLELCGDCRDVVTSVLGNDDDDEEEARYRNPPKFHGVEPAPGMEESEEPPTDDGNEGYDLPSYRCSDCGGRPRLMSDRTAGLSTVGIGCECTVENGRPFVSLGSSAMRLPERWSVDG